MPTEKEIEFTNEETRKHAKEVRVLLDLFCIELIHRGKVHDQSKMVSPEVEAFAIYAPKLKDTTYGSDKYRGFLRK